MRASSASPLRSAVVWASVLASVLGASALLGVGCSDDPPIKLRYELSKGPTQKCGPDCDSMMLYCKSVLSVRIIDPAHPEDPPYLSVCRPLTAGRSLCQVSQVRLVAEEELPRRRLAIQAALYNADELPTDEEGEPICPKEQPFSADGYASPGEYHPAIAGMGYYTPGEEETVIPLGCADVTLVQTQTCQGKNRVKITASADDFDSGVYLQPPVADSVELKVAEPQPAADRVEIPLEKMTKLDRVPNSFPAAWGGERDRVFSTAICLVVLEVIAQSTPTVTCRAATTSDTTFDLRGVRMTRTTLDDVLAAIGASQFPKQGLVIGMVVDSLGQPKAGVTVNPPKEDVTIEYLSAGRERVIGAATSASGIFVSRNAPFDSTWTAPGTSIGYGGLINDKVTVVILQADPQ